jgi:ribosomal protein L25 (general stress protein Ctc)
MNILFVAYNPTSPYHYQFDNQEFKKQLQTHLKEEVINVCMDLENVLWEN